MSARRTVVKPNSRRKTEEVASDCNLKHAALLVRILSSAPDARTRKAATSRAARAESFAFPRVKVPCAHSG